MSEGIDVRERASAVALLATGTGSEGVRLAVERAITAALADRDAEHKAELEYYHGRWQSAQFGLDASATVADECRRFTKEILATNCTWVDDDLRVLAHLADKAVRAGLTDGLPESIRQCIADRAAAIRKGEA